MSLFVKKGTVKLYMKKGKDGIEFSEKEIEGADYIEVKKQISHGEYIKYQKAAYRGMKINIGRNNKEQSMDGSTLMLGNYEILGVVLVSLYDAETGKSIKNITPSAIDELDPAITSKLVPYLLDMYELNVKAEEEEKN